MQPAPLPDRFFQVYWIPIASAKKMITGQTIFEPPGYRLNLVKYQIVIPQPTQPPASGLPIAPKSPMPLLVTPVSRDDGLSTQGDVHEESDNEELEFVEEDSKATEWISSDDDTPVYICSDDDG